VSPKKNWLVVNHQLQSNFDFDFDFDFDFELDSLLSWVRCKPVTIQQAGDYGSRAGEYPLLRAIT
jgi:hypothetical protein